MKAATIRQLLLREGYLLPQLPPVFTSADFAEQSDGLPVAWRKASDARKPEHYSLARHGLNRRDMQIPNPVNQFYVADLIAENWDEIGEHLSKSEISQSKCGITHDSVVGITPHKDLAALRLSGMAGRNYILKSDISRCFPSIYTHSIAWVLHGKDASRQDRRTKDLLGNKLDDAIHRCNDSTSVGIPIGPRTSHIVAEIILSEIDAKIQGKLGRRLKGGYRHVDDYFLCFDSDNHAALALAQLQEAAAEYELAVNTAKTHIVKSMDHREDDWPHKLLAMASNKKLRNERDWLTQFVSDAFSLARQHPGGSVMKFALGVLRHISLHNANWKLYERALLHILTAYPYAIDKVALILMERKAMNYPLDVKMWVDALTLLIARCAPRGHHSEVAWALWLVKAAGLRIRKKATKQLSKVRSGICALLALDCRDSKLIGGDKNLDTEPWLASISEKGLKKQYWLLAYEAPMKGWLGDEKVIDNDSFFSDLKKRGVSFYGENNRATLDDTADSSYY